MNRVVCVLFALQANRRVKMLKINVQSHKIGKIKARAAEAKNRTQHELHSLTIGGKNFDTLRRNERELDSELK